MGIQLPFRYLEPTFFAGLLDDPVLLVRVRPLGSNLLFDCGEIHHLAKRVLTAIEAIFISHTHMQAVGVQISVDDCSLQTHLMTGTDQSDSNFSSICNQYFHGQLTGEYCRVSSVGAADACSAGLRGHV